MVLAFLTATPPAPTAASAVFATSTGNWSARDLVRCDPASGFLGRLPVSRAANTNDGGKCGRGGLEPTCAAAGALAPRRQACIFRFADHSARVRIEVDQTQSNATATFARH